MHLSAFVCLSVCEQVYSKTRGWIWMKSCVSTLKLLIPIQSIVRMLQPDCFFQYRMCCNVEFYYVGEIPHMRIGAAGRCSEAWF